MKKYFFFGALAVVTATIVLFAFHLRTQKKETALETSAPLPISVSTRSLRDARTATSILSFPATVSTESEATIVAQTSGTIVSDMITLGGRTGVGSLLYRIDTTGDGTIHPQTGFESDTVLQAKLALKNAEESYAQAKRTYNRDKNSANKTARDMQKNLRDIAKSQYEATLDTHTVTSPIAGTVFVKSASLGDTVSAGTPLATIGAGKKIARFSVSGDERALLAPRQKITFLETNGTSFSGFVTHIAPVASDTNKQFLVEAESADAAFATLPSGTLTTVSLTLERTGKKDEVLLPLSAITQEQTGTFAFLAENERAKKVPVTIQSLYGETVAISGTFSDDAQFILSNVKRLSDGAAITITK